MLNAERKAQIAKRWRAARSRSAAWVLGPALLVACTQFQPRPDPDRPATAEPQRSIPTSLLLRQPGGFYTDDAPDRPVPVNLETLPDAQPKIEPLHPAANEPYNVFGKEYVPFRSLTGYRRQGTASWYGRKFHGQRTVSGEVYDMFAMTAAHPTLPVPSYARVTNLENNRSVIVRINDRGPFYSERIMDVSYAAAYKLGFADTALAAVEVESVVPVSAIAKPAPEPVPEVVALPVTTERRGLFLQLGAFSSRTNAENFGERIKRQLDWLREDIDVQPRGKLYGVHLGPYRDRAAANAVAVKLREALEVKPIIVVR